MVRYLNGLVWPLLFFSLTACGATMDKFDWKATECAPENYPLQIVKGDFIYPDSGSLYVPDGKTLFHGWGLGHSSHIVGPDLKPLPNQLEITFFSYTENQFYRGSFDLPYEKILSMFDEGYYSPKEKEHITYNQIVAGVAPGGAVAVWLAGIDKTTEIFFGQSEKIDGDWHWINDNPSISREEYIRRRIKNALKTQEAITDLKKDGIPFGLWETYHQTRYHWHPLFTGIPLHEELIQLIKYFNGEEGYMNYPLDTAEVKATRAIPRELHFIWVRPKGSRLSFELYFDEAEIFDIFQQLGSNKQPLQLEMRMEVMDGKSGFSIWLRNSKEMIQLKRTDIKTYGV